jgi:hypothetical protein
MTRILALLCLLLPALPAAAQSPGPSSAAAPPHLVAAMAPTSAPNAVEAALPGVTARHAAALGAGMFAGAMAGSALINGGALAALIGAAAGLAIGHWYWTDRPDETD